MFLTRLQEPRSAFGSLVTLQDELDRLFTSAVSNPVRTPALDVSEDKEKFLVRAELPGLKREDIDVSLQDGVLLISGERKVEKKEDGAEVHLQERYYGKFQRALTLHEAVAADKVKAEYKDGVLTITLPKTEAAKPRKIDVTAN